MSGGSTATFRDELLSRDNVALRLHRVRLPGQRPNPNHLSSPRRLVGKAFFPSHKLSSTTTQYDTQYPHSVLLSVCLATVAKSAVPTGKGRARTDARKKRGLRIPSGRVAKVKLTRARFELAPLSRPRNSSSWIKDEVLNVAPWTAWPPCLMVVVGAGCRVFC